KEFFMKLGKETISRLIVLSFVFFCVFISVRSSSASSITGTIYDNHNNALADVDVELMGNVGAFRNHIRTDTTGRYEFTGLGDGYFTIRVLPFRYDFEEQSQQIYIQTISVAGGG